MKLYRIQLPPNGNLRVIYNDALTTIAIQLEGSPTWGYHSLFNFLLGEKINVRRSLNGALISVESLEDSIIDLRPFMRSIGISQEVRSPNRIFGETPHPFQYEPTQQILTDIHRDWVRGIRSMYHARPTRPIQVQEIHELPRLRNQETETIMMGIRQRIAERLEPIGRLRYDRDTIDRAQNVVSEYLQSLSGQDRYSANVVGNPDTGEMTIELQVPFR